MSTETIIADLSVFSPRTAASAASVCRSFGKVVIARVLDILTVASGTPEPCPGLREAALAAVDKRPLTCWSPELSYANELARRGAVAAGGAGAQLTLALREAGLTGVFEFDLPFGERLMLGNWRVKCHGRSKLSVAVDSVEIIGDDETLGFERADGLWELNGREAGYARAAEGAAITCVAGYDVDPEILIAEDVALESDHFLAACADIDAALAIAALAGDDAAAWIDRSISTVSLVESHGGARLSSRSLSSRAGNVEMAAPGDRLHLSELLIHEAAHQHFHMVRLLGPLTVPMANGQRFLSALNGRQRPLERVLLAYHAVGNIFLFLQRLAEVSDDWREDAIQRLHALGPTAAHLRATLGTNRALLTHGGAAMLNLLDCETNRVGAIYALPVERDPLLVVPGVN